MESCVQSLPKTIKIGPCDWRVVLESDADEYCGLADFATHSLKLWPSRLNSPSHVVSVILHECLHVIYENQNLGKVKSTKLEREEAVVEGFESGLISLFRDNPKFLVWFKKWVR